MKTKTPTGRTALKISVFMVVNIAGIACEHSHSAYQSMLNVHGVIRSDYYEQEIVLSHSFGMNEQEYFDLEETLVILLSDGLCDTMSVHGWCPQGGTFIAWPFVLAPRKTYQIIVYADGYDTLYGQTMTPGDFEIIKPCPGDTVTPNDTLVFSISEGAREYQIAAIDVFEQYEYWIIWPDVEPESLLKLPLAQFSTGVSDGEYTLKVYACDSNFFNYEYYYKDDPPQCGVEGGIGLFGSMWVKSVDVYLKVD